MFVSRFTTEGSLLAYAPPSLCAIEGDPPSDAGAGAPPQQTTYTDDTAAAAVALLNWDSDDNSEAGDSESTGDPPEDVGTDESPSTGEDEGHSEPAEGGKPAAPAIEPPASWSAEDKAVFAKLPPEAQATIARRESERDRLIQQRTQEIADERKAAEAERTAIEGQRSQYLNSLQQLVHLALPEAQAFANVDWAKLAAEQPAEYVRLSAARDALRERVGRLQSEIDRVQRESEAELGKRQQAFLAAQRQQLVEKFPDFADAVKGRQFAKDLVEHMGTYGFTPEEVGQAVDHRLVLLARDAMLYRQGEAARKAAEAKRVVTPPRVQAPNAAAQPEDAKARRIQDQARRLARTGSTRDAALLLENFL